MDLSDFFRNEHQKPLMYSCILSNIQNINELFVLLKKLFYLGISIQNNYDIRIDKRKVEYLDPYFQSLGFRIFFKQFDVDDLHMNYTGLLNDIPENDASEIIVSRHLRSNFIHNISIKEISSDLKKILQQKK